MDALIYWKVEVQSLLPPASYNKGLTIIPFPFWGAGDKIRSLLLEGVDRLFPKAGF